VREYARAQVPRRPGAGRRMSAGSACCLINEWNQRLQLRIPTSSSSVLTFSGNISATARCDGKWILDAGRERCMSLPLNVNMGHEFRVRRADSY